MYLGYQNGKIKFYTKVQLPQEFYNLEKSEYTEKEYVLDGEEYVLKDDAYNEKKAKEEQETINHLTCTALDLATFIKQSGLTDAEVLKFLNANPSLQLQLTFCKDVYCGVVRQLCPLKISDNLTLTDEMVVAFFKQKHNIN